MQQVCERLPQAQCAERRGEWKGEVNCDQAGCAPPPPATGACCLAATAGQRPCAVRTASDCTAAGGDYQGDGSACEPNPCPTIAPPLGACCVAGTCERLTEADCSGRGGDWKGAVACAQANCPPPPPATGACCLKLPDGGGGSCVAALTAQQCAERGGAYLGDGADCAACPPARPAGLEALPAVLEWWAANPARHNEIEGFYDERFAGWLRTLLWLAEQGAGRPALDARFARLPAEVTICGNRYRGFMFGGAILYVQSDATADQPVAASGVAAQLAAGCDGGAATLQAVVQRLAVPTVAEWRDVLLATGRAVEAGGEPAAWAGPLLQGMLWGQPEWVQGPGTLQVIGGATVTLPGGKAQQVPALAGNAAAQLQAWLQNPLARPRGREDGGALRRVLRVFGGD